MVVRTTMRATDACGDEEAFAWATAALGEARRGEHEHLQPVLEALVEDLAFGLGAHLFPPQRLRGGRNGGHRPR